MAASASRAECLAGGSPLERRVRQHLLGLPLGLGSRLATPPVLELLFVELDVQFLDSLLKALLYLADSLVVDEWTHLFEEEAQKGTCANVSDALIEFLGEVTLDGCDGLASCIAVQLDWHLHLP